MKINTIFYNLKTFVIVPCLVAAESAVAGPPFVTDDPEPVAEKSWEVNYAVSKAWARNSTSVAVPSIDINYGLTNNIQLHAQPRYSYLTEGEDKQTGFDNTEIGVKYRFLHREQGSSEFMLGIYPMLQLPTGDKKLGDASGRVQAFLPVWAQLNTGKWIFYGGTGYRINNYTYGKNSWFFGGTALYEVNEKLMLGGEVFRESANAQDANHTSGFNLGGIYNVKKDYSLLFSAGRALNNISETNKLSGFLALQVIY